MQVVKQAMMKRLIILDDAGTVCTVRYC